MHGCTRRECIKQHRSVTKRSRKKTNKSAVRISYWMGMQGELHSRTGTTRRHIRQLGHETRFNYLSMMYRTVPCPAMPCRAVPFRASDLPCALPSPLDPFCLPFRPDSSSGTCCNSFC